MSNIDRPDYLVDIGCLNPIKAKHGKMAYYPCGKCIACQLKKANNNSQQTWFEFHGEKTYPLFVLLTYNNTNIPLCQCSYKRNPHKRNDKYYYSVRITDTLDGEILFDSELSEFNLKTIYRHAKRENINQVLKRFNAKSGTFLFSRVRQYDLQLFHKRLRRNLDKEGLQSYRFGACSEYGPTTNRPHYHIILFCKDEVHRLKVSRLINQSWKLGYANSKLYSGTGCNYISSYITSSTAISYLHRKVSQLRPKFTHSVHFGFKGSEQINGGLTKMLDEPEEFFKSVELLSDGKPKELFPLLQYYRSKLPKLSGHDALYTRAFCEADFGPLKRQDYALTDIYLFPLHMVARSKFESDPNKQAERLSHETPESILEYATKHMEDYLNELTCSTDIFSIPNPIFDGQDRDEFYYCSDFVRSITFDMFYDPVSGRKIEPDLQRIKQRIKFNLRIVKQHVTNVFEYQGENLHTYLWERFAAYYCQRLHTFYGALDYVLLKKQLDKLERASAQFGWIKSGVFLYDNLVEYLEKTPGEYWLEVETDKKNSLYYQFMDYCNRLGEERSKMKKIKEHYTLKDKVTGTKAFGTNRIFYE